MRYMTKTFGAGVALAALLVAGCGEKAGDNDAAKGPVADRVIVGATIYTVDGDNRVVDAMAVREGKILYVGDRAGAQAYVGDGTQVDALDGKVIFPGFTDTHAHVASGGEELNGLSLTGVGSVEEVIAKVKAYADAHPELDFIVGRGWDLTLFPGANPSKDLLDAIVPDRPVYLEGADGHNGWANSKAFEAAGITKDTPDPAKGSFARLPDGTPSGALREEANGAITALLPAPTKEGVIADIRRGMAFQNMQGMTAMVDASVTDSVYNEAFLDLAKDPALPLRMKLSFLPGKTWEESFTTLETVDEHVAAVVKRREDFRKVNAGRVDGDGIKIFVDGVAENFTAAVIEPYVNIPDGHDHHGVMNLAPEALTAFVTGVDKEGFNVLFHSLGDQAVRSALDAVENAEKVNGPRDRRHHLSHLEFVDPADIPRFKELGAVANLQTLWHYADTYITDLTLPHIKEDRQRWIYPAKSFKDAGVKLSWGSDWPVSTSDPFDSIEVAVTRQDPHDATSTPFIPEEALTVDDMIRALTINGAWIMGQDAVRGSLEEGKLADYIVVTADPYKVAPADISEIEVLETVVEGATVYTKAN
ncbi:amidohydrolase [Pseudokordiimonas caeni]|uniref:amidohydrolase n=1 Tax=Pseudokordiimonas caeni TaxID=2997908 RepID=UPI00281269C8|nr:amidohydrolase [Pseudokordiimonas caeni]